MLVIMWGYLFFSSPFLVSSGSASLHPPSRSARSAPGLPMMLTVARLSVCVCVCDCVSVCFPFATQAIISNGHGSSFVPRRRRSRGGYYVCGSRRGAAWVLLRGAILRRAADVSSRMYALCR